MLFDVVTIGTAVVDVIMHASGSKRMLVDTKAGTLCFPLGAKFDIAEKDFLLNSGGGATNTAVTFSRQGLLAGCVAEVGEDVLGALIVEELRRDRVHPLVSVNRKMPTGLSCILVHENGERTVLTMRGASVDLSLSEIPFADVETKWAYIAPGAMPKRRVEEIIRIFEAKGAKVALNPSKAQLAKGLQGMKKILGSVDVLFVNEEEAALVTRIAREKQDAIFKVLDKAVRGIVVMTSGPNGVRVSDGKTVWSAGVFQNKKIVDRLGAGDAFGAGFVAGLLTHEKKNKSAAFSDSAISYAIRLASANATAVVEGLGPKVGILTQKHFQTGARWQKFPIHKNHTQ